jgi:hypothetical protein
MREPAQWVLLFLFCVCDPLTDETKALPKNQLLHDNQDISKMEPENRKPRSEGSAVNSVPVHM